MNMITLSYRFGIGDYRIILVNFKQSDTVGYRVKICSPGMWRLAHKNRIVVEKYSKKHLDLS